MVDVNDLFEQGKLFDGHYKLIDPLSTAGGSADVWLAIDINTIDESMDEAKATKVAIKIYRPKNFIDVEGESQFRNEFKKVFNCHHENIIQPTYFSIYEEMPYLVLPYCPAGSSELLIGQMQSDDDLWKYIYDVASGLAYLHEHTPQIIHQDIKPANVLIDDNGNYAITDFGISAEMGGADPDSEDETGGTFAYMAPERFVENTPPMPESDIWAFGAAVYELITGDAPFGNDGGCKQEKGIPVPPIKQAIPDSLKQLVYDCLSFDPKDRPSARSIVDTVLAKRYSRNKKTLAIIIGAIVLATIGITFYFTNQNAITPEIQLNSLIASGDSIIMTEIYNIQDNSGNPGLENIFGFEKAKAFYSKAYKDAFENYSKKDLVASKIATINNLIEEIKEYDRARDLADKAYLTKMDEEFVRYSLVADNHKITINQLIQQLQ